MWKEPYIEANPAYMSLRDGIENADIPVGIKVILKQMIEWKMGVYKSPYVTETVTTNVVSTVNQGSATPGLAYAFP